MKYYICEGSPRGDYNASNKARVDVNTILKKNGYTPLYVNTNYGVQSNKIKKVLQIVTYLKNYKIWMKKIKELEKGDVIVVQYPLINTTLNFDKILHKCRERGIQTIALIHDLDSLRYTVENNGKHLFNRVNKEDKMYLKNFNFVIAHNLEMAAILIRNYGVKEKNIINLQIFDYLVDNVKFKNININSPIIIAGNLDKNKAGYIGLIKNLEVNFNLYGVGFDMNDISSNVHYCGVFKPEELLDKLNGSFGLVWDGNSIDGGHGQYGNYLRYNNPHKASLYLSAGIPIIVWSKSAIAAFIEKNNLGLVIDNLHEINEKSNKLTEENYLEIVKNCRNISTKIRNGYYLEAALKKLNREV